MKSLRFGDMASGVFLVLLGLIVVLAAIQIKGAPDVRMQPRTLPLILGWTVLAAGAALAIRAWRYRGPVRTVPWPDRVGILRVGITFAGLVIFLFLVEPLGSYRPVYAGLLGLATGGTIYVVFIRLLNLSFPIGPLGR
jgi:hypothetical protein